MNYRAVFRLIAFMLLMVALFMLLSAFLGWAYGDEARSNRAFLLSALITAGLSGGLLASTRGTVDLSRRDGFLVVVFGWLFVALTGALPYYIGGSIPDFMGALFETMSGLTTTGASVMSHLEQVPRGILFWRSVTQLLGGMGVLVLCVAILPFLGMGGMQIYRAEMPGPSKDRLTPRIATTAKMLWGTYVILVGIQMLLLRFGGMDWFEAVCHSFTTLSTGGFSTRTASIAAFNSVYIESVIMAFMFLGGVNFALHYRALLGQPQAYFKNSEFRFFAGLMGVSILGVAGLLWWNGVYPSLFATLRISTFHVLSCSTTTGFVTENYDLWPHETQLILILLMFAGACCGSTTGALKNLRVLVMLKKIMREVRMFLLPQAVFRIKINQAPLAQDTISNISAFVAAYLLVFVSAFLAMLFFTQDFVTASSSVIATLGCVGPGLSGVGPMTNYAWLPGGGKAVLILCMLLGRLELYSVLVLFLPSFWKK